MLVVADSSPLIVLVKIGHIDVLPALFGQVLIPPAVDRELRSPRRAEEVREYFRQARPWLQIRPPARVEPVAELHRGELEAISLALECGAHLVLVDDRKAYRAAVALNLNVVGTVRVLERAAEQRLLDLREAFDRLKQTDFWISHSLLEERLRIFYGG